MDASSLPLNEKKLLATLYKARRGDINSYVNLNESLAELGKVEIENSSHKLQEKKWIECVQNIQGNQTLCKITENGKNALGKFTPFFESIKYDGKKAGIAIAITTVLLVLTVDLSIKGGVGKFLTGDITNLSPSSSSISVIENWISQSEQDDPTHYTYNVMNKAGNRSTYIVECKTEFTSACKYNIVFVDVDETTGQILNTEIPWKE